MIVLFFRIIVRCWDGCEIGVAWIEQWVRTRRWDRALTGIPAVIYAASLLLILAAESSKSARERSIHYAEAFADALAKMQLSEANLWLKKLDQLGVLDNHSRMQFALLAAAEGQDRLVREQMLRLAPENHVGYPPAHRWVAQDLYSRRKSWSAEERRRCVHHLQASLPQETRGTQLMASDKGRPESPTNIATVLVHKVAGTVAAAEGKFDLARYELELASVASPDDPIVLNNLAWVLAHRDPAALPRAMALTERAVTLLPGHPELLETQRLIRRLLRERRTAFSGDARSNR